MLPLPPEMAAIRSSITRTLALVLFHTRDMLPVASERHISRHFTAVMFLRARKSRQLSRMSSFFFAGAARDKLDNESKLFWKREDAACCALADSTASRRVSDDLSSHTARLACKNSYKVSSEIKSCQISPQYRQWGTASSILDMTGHETSCQSIPSYGKFMYCFHSTIAKSECEHPFFSKVGFRHPMDAIEYDGWLLQYRYSNQTFVHHAMKNPPIGGINQGYIIADRLLNN